METPFYQTLLLEVNGAAGTLTLNRPDVKNALNGLLLQEITQACQWLNKLEQVRLVKVCGAGAVFCAGADINDLPIKDAMPESGLPWHERREIGQQGKRMIDALADLNAVTVAQVQGAAVGGGLLVMLACDFRVVSEDCLLMIPEVDLGIPLAWGGIPRLVREIGPSRTKELVMTCRRFSPQEALNIGLINRVSSKENLHNECDDLLRTLMSKPSVPLIISKDQINGAAQALVSTDNSYADGDLLLGLAQDPETMKHLNGYIDRLGRKS